jgi:hypothetical protein
LSQVGRRLTSPDTASPCSPNLEQAEQQRFTDTTLAAKAMAELVTTYESRLARVPALVEALAEAADWLDADLALNQENHDATYAADRQLITLWRAAVAAWENE